MITLRQDDSIYILTSEMEWIGSGPMQQALNTITQNKLLRDYDPSKGDPRLYVAQKLALIFPKLVLFEDESAAASIKGRIY